MGVVAAAPRTAAGRVPALGGAAVGCAGLAMACGRRVVQLVAGVATAGPDELVELAVLATGAAVLAWLAGSAALAAACLLVRRSGGLWRHGEAWLHRFAPTIIRRALVVTVAAGLGAAAMAPASAADQLPTASPTAATVRVADAGPDLGWVVTGLPAAPAPTPVGTAGQAARPGTGSFPGTWGPTTSTPDLGPSGGPPIGGDGTPGAATTPRPSGAAARAATAPTTPAARDGSAPTTGAIASDAATGAAGPVVSARPAHAGRTQTAAAPVADQDALPVPHGAPAAPGQDPTAATATVVVVRGDTLWDIAARHLPAGASAADVAAAWPAWYAANAATIGPDPGLILPGQVLVVPSGVTR